MQCALFSMNSAPHSATGVSPFQLMFGRQPNILSDSIMAHAPTIYQQCDQDDYLTDLASAMKEHIAEATANLTMRREQYAVQKEKGRNLVKYDVGDIVWALNYRETIKKTRKLSSPWMGPCRVEEVYGNTAILSFPLEPRRNHFRINFGKISRATPNFCAKLPELIAGAKRTCRDPTELANTGRQDQPFVATKQQWSRQASIPKHQWSRSNTVPWKQTVRSQTSDLTARDPLVGVQTRLQSQGGPRPTPPTPKSNTAQARLNRHHLTDRQVQGIIQSPEAWRLYQECRANWRRPISARERETLSRAGLWTAPAATDYRQRNC